MIDTHFERKRRRGSGEASNTARPKNHTAHHHPHDEVKSHFVSKRTKRLSALTSTKLSDLKTFCKEQLLGQLAKLEQHIRRPRDFPPVSMANTRDEIAAALQRCRQKVFQRKPQLKVRFKEEAKATWEHETSPQILESEMAFEICTPHCSKETVAFLFQECGLATQMLNTVQTTFSWHRKSTQCG